MALPAKGSVPLAVVVRRYLSHRRQVDRLALPTVQGYAIVLVNFETLVGPIEVGRIQPRHVTRYVREKTASGLSTAALGTYLSRLKMFARWCQSEKYTTQNFMAHAHHPRRPRSTPRGLSREQIEATIAACQTPRERMICHLMWQAGLRAVEVSRVQRCDIDLDQRLLLVHGKGDHQRELPIVPRLESELRVFLQVEPIPSTGFLIRNERDGYSQLSPKGIGQLVVDIFRRAGVKHARLDGRSGHAYRHSLANELLDADVDVRDVQEILGHAHASTTLDIYGKRRRATTRLRAALEARDD